MENNNSSPLEEKNKVNRLTPHELIEKHIKDNKHIITEEELKNLKVGLEAENESGVSKEINKKDDEVLSNNNNLPNPFNIVNS